MKTQESNDVEGLRREARVLVAGWPRALLSSGVLSTVELKRPSDGLGHDLGDRLDLVRAMLGAWMPGSILVADAGLAEPRLGDMVEIVGQLAAEGDRAPVGRFSRAVGFIAVEGRHGALWDLWRRACAYHGQRYLALMTCVPRGEVTVAGPFRGRMARLVTRLPYLPVVSGEVLARLDESERAPAYRWSNRVDALRRAGLLVEMPEGVDLAELRRLHAQALGRTHDRRPTKLYRSAAFDLRLAAQARSQVSYEWRKFAD